MGCWGGYDLGTPDGKCPDCDADTTDGQSSSGCGYSSAICDKCGDQPCDGSC